MPAKLTQRGASKAASATKKPGPKATPAPKKSAAPRKPRAPDPSLDEVKDEVGLELRATETPGVYLNSRNVRVDENGVALSFKQLQTRDTARWEQVIGTPVDTPAKLLKAVALDPVQALLTRVDAAKAAAPYFDRKMPVAMDGGVDPTTGAVVPLFDMSKVSGMSDEELKQLRGLLTKAGATP